MIFILGCSRHVECCFGRWFWDPPGMILSTKHVAWDNISGKEKQTNKQKEKGLNSRPDNSNHAEVLHTAFPSSRTKKKTTLEINPRFMDCFKIITTLTKDTYKNMYFLMTLAVYNLLRRILNKQTSLKPDVSVTLPEQEVTQ